MKLNNRETTTYFPIQRALAGPGLLLFSLIAFLLLCGNKTTAQDNSIRFENITINDGLSQSSVNQVIQDRHGFIWMATQDGLNRFDGHQFKVYKNEPDNPNSLSNSYINRVYEASDGIIWVGTEEGLNKYNPAKDSFERIYSVSNSKSNLVSNKVSAIAEDKNGKIWIGTPSNGLSSYNKEENTFSNYKSEETALLSNNIKTLFVDKKGVLWIGSADGLNYLDPESREIKNTFLSERLDTLNSKFTVWAIKNAKDGSLWLGTSFGLAKYEPDTKLIDFHYPKNENWLVSPVNINTLYRDENDVLWMGSAGKGLYKYQEGKFTRYSNSQFNPNSLLHNMVYTIYEDYSGNIWVGTKNGISKFDKFKQGFVHISKDFSGDNTIQDNNIWCFEEDDSGNVYLGTQAGLTYYDRSNDTYYNYFRKANNINNPNDNSVLSLWIDDGFVWVGYVDGLYKATFSKDKRSVKFEQVTYKEDLQGENDPRVYDILKDQKGFLWVATREGLSRLNPETGKYRFFRHNPSVAGSLPAPVVRTLLESEDGTIWVGTHGGGLCMAQQGESEITFRAYRKNPSDTRSISSNIVLSIYEQAPGHLWLGTYAGLNHFDVEAGVFTAYTKASHDLANDVLYGILEDDNRHLWISSNGGLIKFDLDTREVRNFYEGDGLQSNEFNIGAYRQLSTGEMAFGGINGFNLFRPENISYNTIEPKVVLTSFSVENVPYTIGKNSIFKKSIFLTDKIDLPYDKVRFSIEFAALHFTDPSSNQYKFILEGLDADYTVVQGNEYHANYSNLPPGEYIFKVYATNSDGVMSKEPAQLKIVVEEPYWKTGWFQGIVIVFVLGAAYFFFWTQVRSIRSQKIKLEKIVAERTKEVTHQNEEIQKQKELLQKEKDKVEKLLLNVLPEQTAEELKSKGKASARTYRRVTIMFADFKNFTKIAEDIKPAELVARLDNYFIHFDQIIEKYGLEKIKTIGDAYMCAGGVPVRNKENPIHTVLAALDIQAFMEEEQKRLKAKGEKPWELRIGINTGQVIAGVIGAKKFAYDIWGNSVNVAARMETSCDTGKVNVSGRTFDHIEPYFSCNYRGKIPAKNKGQIDMYYVEQVKPELTEEDGTVGRKFWDYVNLHLFSSINYMKAERFIMKLLKKRLSPKLYYHGIHHTKDVTEAAERLALMEGIKGEDVFLLQTAATYHDAGFVEQYDANEPVGIRMAQEILPKYGYTEEQIEVIAGLIYATIVPHDPKTHLQEIICDADLDYLGRDDFHEIADTLKRELMEHGKIQGDRQWDEIQVKFLTMHKFFTKSAIKLRQAKKEKHLEEIKQRLEEDNYGS